jgi:DNA-3-methyladenine glycosylase I
MNVSRCSWCGTDPIYQAYHDQEWGRAIRNEMELFELLNLEGAQAGLSWITVLKKRNEYRRVFLGFEPERIVKLTDVDLDALLLNPGIIRNRLKVYAVRENAEAYLALKAQGVSFSEFLWSFVDGAPKINSVASMQALPVRTPESDAMSKALKKLGFKFVGSTICYAFMQASGMVNDHLDDCFVKPSIVHSNP